MKFGVLTFPGSNCDHDCYHTVKHVFGQEAEFLWHKTDRIEGIDCVILPGGFSYGDYLRTGAIARFSPVMKAVERYAADGGLVIGICNGFQILLEAGLLPGAMLRNKNLKFICSDVHMRVGSNETPFTSRYKKKQILTIPIAHADGNYYCDDETLAKLETNNQVIFRYCDKSGAVTDEANPNGSRNNIAGICNEKRNVLGMMPHPERCIEGLLGSAGNEDGRGLFESIIAHVEAQVHA